MSTFKERLIDEGVQLSDKIQKLEAFTYSDNFGRIDPIQAALLTAQLPAMKTYQAILKERIIRLKE